ncbi:hypothetical protein M422DRAFT_256466 [Sphaerobolus stellatus SS14]|uniref:Uncharacterized protein n=1 Tax=Sphaerobolus stellatus (strain SS14) TaxID=990650 RepID=A0A0C9VQK7_SPHS4|nr:hypothetical protein M422DRAFT_256466 [Sphaerobolus stellatus SS14]
MIEQLLKELDIVNELFDDLTERTQDRFQEISKLKTQRLEWILSVDKALRLDDDAISACTIHRFFYILEEILLILALAAEETENADSGSESDRSDSVITPSWLSGRKSHNHTATSPQFEKSQISQIFTKEHTDIAHWY